MASSPTWADDQQVARPLKKIVVNQAALDRYVQTKSVIDQLLAPVKSADDLRAFLSKAKASENPLSKLDVQARQDFIESISFNEKGLTGYNYSILESNLTLPQIRNVLALFGSQTSIRNFRSSKSAPAPGGSDNAEECELMPESGEECIDGDGGNGGGGGGGGWGGGGGGGGGGGYSPIGGGETSDHKDYKCEGKGTCASQLSYICTSNC